MMVSYLPHDLEWEILSRVPTKSLVKLQTTCKRWYILFKDLKFIKKNKGKSAREVILLMNLRVYSVGINLHSGIEPNMEFRGKLSTLMDSVDFKISKLFHCDGLILCVTKGNTRLIVWNPCTGESRWIEPRSCDRCYDLYALGYGNNNYSFRTYKILRFCCQYIGGNFRVAEFEMYEFSSDAWRVLDVDTYYWIAFDKETGFFLLNFDFTTERFGGLSLPFQSQDWKDTSVLSVVKDERLSLLYQNLSTFSLVMEIWVTNKIVDTKYMSWSNFLVVDFEKFMLPSVTNVISFLLDEENKVAVCCDKGDEARTRIYIVGEDIYIYIKKLIKRLQREHG